MVFVRSKGKTMIRFRLILACLCGAALAACDSHPLDGFCDKAFECNESIAISRGECAEFVENALTSSNDSPGEEVDACRDALISVGDRESCESYSEFTTVEEQPCASWLGVLQLVRLF